MRWQILSSLYCGAQWDRKSIKKPRIYTGAELDTHWETEDTPMDPQGKRIITTMCHSIRAALPTMVLHKQLSAAVLLISSTTYSLPWNSILSMYLLTISIFLFFIVIIILNSSTITIHFTSFFPSLGCLVFSLGLILLPRVSSPISQDICIVSDRVFVLSTIYLVLLPVDKDSSKRSGVSISFPFRRAP